MAPQLKIHSEKAIPEKRFLKGRSGGAIPENAFMKRRLKACRARKKHLEK